MGVPFNHVRRSTPVGWTGRLDSTCAKFGLLACVWLAVACQVQASSARQGARILNPGKCTKHLISTTLSTRGGSSQVPHDFPQTSGFARVPSDGTMYPEAYAGAPVPENDDPFHETVQERVDYWRTQQRQQAAANMYSPRDEKGRMKLLTSVGKGSRALIFFVLMWRDVHLYEVADQLKSGLTRLFFVIPLAVLFIANMAGAVASITSPSQSAKKRLKAILNLDKLLEVLLIVFYFLRLTIAPSKYTPREIYISNTLHSVFFILQCQAFTKMSWDETAAQPVNSYTTMEPEKASTTPSSTLADDGWYDSQAIGDFKKTKF
jgi:succinate dehydrogenase hydrophobic anchor subunit